MKVIERDIGDAVDALYEQLQSRLRVELQHDLRIEGVEQDSLSRVRWEDGVVTVSRAQGTVTFRANLMMVAAMNPCPCGFHGDPTKQCSCSPSTVTRYQHRISGPLLDRIDIFVDVPRVEYEKLTDEVLAEATDTAEISR